MSAPADVRVASPDVATPVAAASWAPPAVARGTVVVVPGRGETEAHYARLGRRLSADGYQVEVLDGLAPDAAAVARAWHRLAEDGRLEARPRVLLATDVSAAAAVAALAGVAAAAVEADGLVLAGAAPGEGVLADAAPETGVDEAVAAHTACPVHRAVWAEHGEAALAALGTSTDAARDWPLRRWVAALPTLVLHGEDDAIAPARDVLDLVRGFPRARVVTVRAGVHDVLNDAAHRSVAAEVVRFLEALRDPEPGRAAVTVRSDRLTGTAPTAPTTPTTSGDPA